jgi:hypothetical protein
LKERHLEITLMTGCKVAWSILRRQDQPPLFRANRMIKLHNFKVHLENVLKRVVLYFTGFAKTFLNFRRIDIIVAPRRSPTRPESGPGAAVSSGCMQLYGWRHLKLRATGNGTSIPTQVFRSAPSKKRSYVQQSQEYGK